MVLLVVKGTKFPDQFTYECKLTDSIADSTETDTVTEGLSTVLSRIQNNRHQIRTMLLSAQELIEEIKKGGYTPSCEDAHRLTNEYAALVEEFYGKLKDTNRVIESAGEWVEAMERLRQLTVALYPTLCQHQDGVEAAIQHLYNQLENPDLGEDERLRVYHCRALLDPKWKAEECTPVETAALWFCGRRLEGKVSDTAGHNEKSKIIVKIAPKEGSAPSGEPRISYDDQRALYQRIREKRETFKTLEESELRDRVVHQYRNNNMVTPSMVAQHVPDRLDTSHLRPIHSKTTETVL